MRIKILMMTEINHISQRISQINAELFDGNKSEFARIIGIGESNVRSYLSGTMPKADVLEKIATNTAINCEWLLTGNGEMLKTEPQNALQRAAKHFDSKTKRLENVGNMILGTREQPASASTDEAWLRSMIEDQRRQIADQQETIKMQARTIETMAQKGAAADAPNAAKKAPKG